MKNFNKNNENSFFLWEKNDKIRGQIAIQSSVLHAITPTLEDLLLCTMTLRGAVSRADKAAAATFSRDNVSKTRIFATGPSTRYYVCSGAVCSRHMPSMPVPLVASPRLMYLCISTHPGSF